MKFTVYFLNHTTGVIISACRTAMCADSAYNNFRRYLRHHGDLQAGETYNIIIYSGWRDLSAVPYEELQRQAKVAR